MTSGEIVLRSGKWAWRVQTVRDAESQEVVWSSCWLHLLDTQESRMHLRLGPGETEFDEESLVAAACHPWDRDIVDPSARGWTFVELNRPPASQTAGPDYRDEPCRVFFFCQDGRSGVGKLPERWGLGQATDEELLDLIQKAI